MKAYRFLSIINIFNRFLAGPTGGIAYHVAAFKYRDSLWRPFINDVERWFMQEWGPSLDTAKSTELIIFGPSAGWTLSEKSLARFSKVICVEPDPLARLLFRLRFRKIRVEFDKRSDRLPWFAKDRSPQKIGRATEELLAKYPNAAILFSNLLGQIQLLMEKPSASFNERAQRTLLAALTGREWASYHDVVSTTLTPKLSLEKPAANLNDLVEQNFEIDEDRHVTDHETEWLGSAQTSIWQIRPGVYHLVGFMTSQHFIARAGRPKQKSISEKSFELQV